MGLASVMVFVRFVGLAEYGKFAVLFALVSAVAAGSAGWLSQGILRYASSSDFAGVFSKAVRRAGVISAVVVGSVLVAFELIRNRAPSTLLAEIALFLAIMHYNLTLARFQSALKPAKVVRLETIRAISTFVFPLAFVLLFQEKSATVLLAGVLAGYLVALVFVSGWNSRNRIEELEDDSGLRNAVRQLWSYGWPVGVWLCFSQLFVVIDRSLLGALAGYIQAGIYASLYETIVRSFAVIFFPVTLAVHPMLMEHWNRNERAAAIALLKGAITMQVLLFLPALLACAFFAPTITRLILGHHDPVGQKLVLPLALCGFFWQMALLAHKLLEMTCSTRRMLGGIVLSVGLGTLLNYLFIPRYGAFASALIAVVCALFYLGWTVLVTPREHLEAEVMTSADMRA